METISKAQIKKYFRDICEAVAYLHSQNIMHRDIKVFRVRFSLKMYYWPKMIKPNYVILDLLPF